MNLNKSLRRKFRNLKIGTLNCRGLTGKEGEMKKTHIAEDMRKYNLEILTIQETHLEDQAPEEISTIDGKQRYVIYHSKGKEKNNAGTAIIVKKGTNVKFKAISDRICLSKIKANNKYTITVICAYAPTLPVSESDPKTREDFYEELESVVRGVSSRDYLIVAGDFNAKTGKEWTEYPDNIGRYGKGEINNNGRELLEFCNRQSLTLSNTLFRHKMAHRTTWESPANYTDRQRRNPYRNLIDYIIIRNNQRHTLQDARSHNGLMTYTDHRLVRATLCLERLHIAKKGKSHNIAIEKLQNPVTSSKFAVNVEMKIMDAEDRRNGKTSEMSAQERWNLIVESNRQAAEETLGKREKRAENNTIVEQLSREQKDIYNKINAIKDEVKRKELKRSRNLKMKQIHTELGKEKTRKIENEIREIEQSKDDSNRMYKAIKAIQRMKPKTPLVIEDTDGVTTDEKRQVELITDFFEKMFCTNTAEKIEEIQPKSMNEKFTEKEIKEAIQSLKNNKSAGIDEIRAEYLKKGPDITYEKIAELLNHVAATGDFPEEINTGILVPLQKPGKKRGPTSNLRPVILLSMIRKILAICLIRRISERVDKEIPITQAAYRSGRGTTEQLMTLKLMAEKAATTPNYETTVLLMDMSKAFDRVRRGTLLDDLKAILEEDELHLVKILIKDVKLIVRVGKEKGKAIKTNIGVPQGDCLSPILFTLYLARALSNGDLNRNEDYQDQLLELPPHLRDHPYSEMQRTGTTIPLQYADDVCWVAMNSNHIIQNIKQSIPAKLESRNLIINKEKTEEYRVRKDGDEKWQTCKYLGTLLDSTEDIKEGRDLQLEQWTPSNTYAKIVDSRDEHQDESLQRIHHQCFLR